MKQHITIDQLNELSEKGKEKLREWWKPTTGDFYTREIAKEKIEKENDRSRKWNEKLTNYSKKMGYKNPPRLRTIVNVEDCSIKYTGEILRQTLKWKSTRTTNVFPLLSIGQMIEFLDEYCETQKYLSNIVSWHEHNKDLENKTHFLCDQLWKAVKEVLEKA